MTLPETLLRDFLALLWPPSELQVAMLLLLLALAFSAGVWERRL